MKILAMLGAASLAISGIAASPAEAQYHHGYHGGHHGYGYGHRGYYRGHYRAGYGYHGHRGFRHYGHRRVCNRFGRCHRI